MDALNHVAEQAAKYNAAILKTDVCPGCQRPYPEFKIPVITGIPVIVGKDKTYSHICIDLCQPCVEAKNYNRIKQNLAYLIMEFPARKLND